MAKRKSKSTRRKGRVPPQLRAYLFKKGHRKIRRKKNPARKRRRSGAGLKVAEQRITTVKRRAKNPRRRRRNPARSEHAANRALHRAHWVLVAKGPGGKELRYTGAKFADHGSPYRYANLPAVKAAARQLRQRYHQVLARYALYGKPMLGK